MAHSVSIGTDRLIIRSLRPADTAVLAAYRDDPDVARLQDWDLPYTVADAERLVDQMAELEWPALGEWIQLAVEHDGQMVGDLGIGRSADGLRATIGYTFATAHHGRGFATEATAAIVDRLFDEGVHRIVATVDPANHASARVLDRLGFRYEGRDVSSVLVRGEWYDDDRYALLASERAAWLGRDRTPPTTVALVEVTPDNRDELATIRTHHSQEMFVAPMATSFADALVPGLDPAGGPVTPWLRAIEADGTIVGFVMVAEASPTKPDPFLWRFLVDRRHQGRGIGRRAIEELVTGLRADGHRRVLVGWHPGHGGPEPFYLGLGFVPTGEIDDGETIAALDLR